ncbi:flagellar basal body rod protein FlgB [Alicyclobacillus contaminans]|uniref:flagellar basal body rod protein FlgB n=1 Tax=Alicyclobacillus contaminans TaxID=392016 RepID=UPI00041C8BBF|nr:flagellar basal body rod protein FlgB [Alicyclobacillus contaminans]GMA49044.1 flagellar basal body rod protein FlgB [Alicyclobacillus contaminans]
MNSEITAFQLLQNAMQAAQLRQQVYSNNIANIDTPGYHRQDVTFESLLQNALNTSTVTSDTGEKWIPLSQSSPNWQAALNVQPQVVTDTSTTVDNNGNNVDVDAEMARLAENQIQYNALVQDMQMRLDRLKNAIDGGGA